MVQYSSILLKDSTSEAEIHAVAMKFIYWRMKYT